MHVVVDGGAHLQLLQPDGAVGQLHVHEEGPEGRDVDGRGHAQPRLWRHAHRLQHPRCDGVREREVHVRHATRPVSQRADSAGVCQAE